MLFVLLVINTLLELFAIALIIVGSIHDVCSQIISELEDTRDCGYLMITTGCLLLAIAVLGSITSFHAKKKLLVSYGVALILIQLLQIATGLIGILQVLKITYIIDHQVKDKFQSFYIKNNTNETQVNEIQQTWKCCGFRGVTKPMEKWDSPLLPKSCCLRQKEKCTKIMATQIDCRTKGKEIFENALNTVGGFAVVFALGEFFVGWWSLYTAQKNPPPDETTHYKP